MSIKNLVPTEGFLRISYWVLEPFLLQVTKSNTAEDRIWVKNFCLYSGEVRVEVEQLV